ncbi:MAG: DegV family protein [Chloroflexi bacterium]|nr:DegV family protein [Chloroflexota bacterium]
MTKTHVITDTDSNIPPELAKALHISLVPITIQFGEESFADNIEIKNPELFERIDRLGKLPTTAAPSPAAFSKAFQTAFDDGAESILCICVGSKVSRTYESALVAVEEFPEKKITVIDSTFVSMGQGFMVISAAEALASGATHEEAVAAATALIPRMHLYASLSTLKYLALGGRVSNLAASMASMLSIRPILTMKDGKLDLLEKIRTRKAAMERLVELIVQAVDGKPIERICIIHVLNPEDARVLESELQKKLTLPESISTEDFGPGLSVHTGSGMIGAIILTGK